MKLVWRIFWHYLHNSAKLIVGIPVDIVLNSTNRRRNSDYFRIKIFELMDSRATNKFYKETCEALMLIRNLDPRRYSRVLKQIKIIINIDFRAKLNYAYCTKSCHINLLRFYHSRSPNLLIEEYACALVHIATNGHIQSKFFAYQGRNRPRIARLSIIEEMRFARRIDNSEYDWGKHFSKELSDLGQKT